MNLKHNCPKCGANEFITEPNQYDILTFGLTGFYIQSTEQVEQYRVFCRECFEEIDLLRSISEITLKK